MEPVNFSKTTFYKGPNATYGKVLVKLEVLLSLPPEGGFIAVGLFAGLDKMYRVGDIGQFLNAVKGRQDYHFSKILYTSLPGCILKGG